MLVLGNFLQLGLESVNHLQTQSLQPFFDNFIHIDHVEQTHAFEQTRIHGDYRWWELSQRHRVNPRKQFFEVLLDYRGIL